MKGIGMALLMVTLLMTSLGAGAQSDGSDATESGISLEQSVEHGAELYAARCARCHGVSLDMALSSEDAPRLADFLATHKTRFDQDRTAEENADLAAYLVSINAH